MGGAVTRDHRVAAADDDREGDQGLFDPGQPRHGDLAAADEVGQQDGQVRPGRLQQGVDLLRGGRRVADQPAQVPVARLQFPRERRQIAGEGLDGGTLVGLCPEDRPRVLDQRDRLGERVGRRLDEFVAGVHQPAQPWPGAGEGLAQLVDGGAQIVLADRVDQPVEADDEVGGRQWHPGVLARYRAAVEQVGAAATPGLQVDVLLAHRRAVGDHGQGVGRDPGCVVLDLQGHRHPRAGQPQLAHPAHRHPSVGDLGAGEDAPGRGEVGAHGVAPVENLVHQAGVLGADVRHPDGGEDGEGEQLGLDRTCDHGWIPFSMSSASAGSIPGGRRPESARGP